MICRVYCESAGHLLLVPECMLVSREAERRFGRLRDCGVIDTQELPGDVLAQVESELDRQSFAALPPDPFGGDPLGLRGRRAPAH